MKSLVELRPLPDELRENWFKAYEHWHVNPPTPIHIADMERLIKKAGITEGLIVAVLERGLSLRKPHAIAWAKKVIEGLVPYGITTVEEWREFEKEQAASAQAEQIQRVEQRPQRKVDSNVILKPQAPGDYSYVYSQFETKPDQPKE